MGATSGAVNSTEVYWSHIKDVQSTSKRIASMSSVSRHISLCHGWPPELSDYLIDHVWDSKPTLSSCSLVCRTWVRRSRHHLFQEVNISVKRSPKLDVFLAFLDSSPHLSSSIRRLTLHGTVADDKLGYAVWFYVSSETLLNCLDKLPHLAELCLRGIRLTENIGVGGGPTIATSFHHRRPVQRLLLSNVFVHPDRLFHILHFFPRLLSLVAEAIYWTLDNEPPSSDVHCLASPPLPMLESVTLGAESSYQMPVYFFPRLQRSIDITAMRCLTLHFDRLDTCPQITNFMDCAGPQLQTLRIIIGKRARVTAVDSFVDSLKLQRCSALAEFGFTLDATYSRSKDPSAAWSLLHSVVVKLPNNVRRLTITHRLDYDTLHVGLCDWNWSALDAELSNKGLSSVVIHSPAHNSDTRINATHMRDGAGACHSRIEPSEVFFRTSLPTLSKSHSLSFNS